MKMKIIAVLIMALCFTGCTGRALRDLSKNGAIVRADINSPWGKQTVTRIGTTTNSVRVTVDGEIIVNEQK